MVICSTCQRCSKTISLANQGQLDGDRSLLIKGAIPSYDIHGKDNEPLLNMTGSSEMDCCKKSNTDAVHSFYIVGNAHDKSRSQSISNTRSWGCLNILSILNRNSGLADGGNSWVNRGFVVPVRKYSTGKGSRSESFKKNQPTGLLELEKLIKENLEGSNKDKQKVKHILCDTEVLIAAYSRIRSNQGAMTPGVDKETLDGIRREDFDKIARQIATGQFAFKPSKRIEIPKPKGGTRSLGIPSPRDKIVQEAMRMILEAIYEPTFANFSHGFRPNRSCHSALNYVKLKFGSANWFIESDIKKCFDSFDHKLIIELLKEKIEDQVFMDLMYKALKAGYVDFSGKFNPLEIGTPQGSIISPILCNIYLDLLDNWLSGYASIFNQGTRKKTNPRYRSIMHKIQMAGRNLKVRKKLRNQIHELKLQSVDPKDPRYKRMVMVRYADDVLIGVIGSKSDVIRIREDLRTFLTERLQLTLSLDKSKITHSSKDKAYFLGTEIRITPYSKRPLRTLIRNEETITCAVTPRPQLLAPIKKIVEKLKAAGYCKMKNNRPTRKGSLIHYELETIIEHYLAIASGIINYYSFASNFARIRARVLYILYYSCVLTFASKLKLKTKAKVITKYGTKLKVESKVRKSGNIEFDINTFPRTAKGFMTMNYDPLSIIESYRKRSYRTNQTLQGPCKICGSDKDIEIHHMKHLRKMNKAAKGDYLTQQMIKMNRKQIPLCQKCHNKVHKGEYSGPKLN